MNAKDLYERSGELPLDPEEYTEADRSIANDVVVYFRRVYESDHVCVENWNVRTARCSVCGKTELQVKSETLNHDGG